MVATSNITMKMRSGTDTIRAIIKISETGMGRERGGGREEREGGERGGGGRRGREEREVGEGGEGGREDNLSVWSNWNESSNEVMNHIQS